MTTDGEWEYYICPSTLFFVKDRAKAKGKVGLSKAPPSRSPGGSNSLSRREGEGCDAGVKPWAASAHGPTGVAPTLKYHRMPTRSRPPMLRVAPLGPAPGSVEALAPAPAPASGRGLRAAVGVAAVGGQHGPAAAAQPGHEGSPTWPVWEPRMTRRRAAAEEGTPIHSEGVPPATSAEDKAHGGMSKRGRPAEGKAEGNRADGAGSRGLEADGVQESAAGTASAQDRGSVAVGAARSGPEIVDWQTPAYTTGTEARTYQQVDVDVDSMCPNGYREGFLDELDLGMKVLFPIASAKCAL